MGIGALAVEQRAAHLVLELLDGAGQRRLRHVTALGGAGEVQVLAEREEIADLMHFHGMGPVARPIDRASVGHAGIKSGRRQGTLRSRKRDGKPGAAFR